MGVVSVNRPGLPEGFAFRLMRQFLTELGPLLIFFGVFMWRGLIWGTAAYAAATAMACLVSWHAHRRMPILPMISGLLVLVFAGLTLALEDGLYIKIKPTVVNGFYGIVLGVGWLLGLPLVDRILGSELRLDEVGLRMVTIATSGYLIGLAILNEIVWRSLPTDQWVTFKVFVIVGANLAFVLLMLPFVRRHIRVCGEPGRGPAGRPPDIPPATS